MQVHFRGERTDTWNVIRIPFALLPPHWCETKQSLQEFAGQDTGPDVFRCIDYVHRFE